tara:strand:+ start:223 stop:612 length:390 start_codon:yes stop_codon:yes gene_type:complete
MTVLFIASLVVLLVYAIRLMARGYTANYIDPGEEVNRPRGAWTTQVKKPVHPEMVDVKPGEQLLGVTFQKEVPNQKIEDPRFKLDSPALHDLDPLHESLRNRIENGQVEDPWEDDDDDDDGGDLVVVRK